ncbi:MAG: hypothetical protein M3R68_03120 [Acidobacteriota bacterium]|nr:hypothetical protein [Acidobacteriota bacterium]
MKAGMISVNNLLGAVAAGIFTFAIPAFAQRPPPGPPPGAGPPADINPRREDLIRQTNQAKLRSAEMEADSEAENQKHIQAALANMKQDFARIQVLRNDIARSLVAHKPLDYNLITEQASEISKRAQRLNVYMLARAPEQKEEGKTTELKNEEMIDALVRLCKLIDSFTENPALKNAATIEAKEVEKAKEDKARADKDLLALMKLSESIQKKSESLKAPR